ncbi:PREDICTED: probable E3 ubiquitin-protein ligase LOG2 [Ipomoea nil]|uniref:probable E3 ubiquitin-protein ligase LOG2 n=1 Tax=Ipomoea nil TaxID=35883 RepID=UPI000900998C|nr:PREDICTED: probable E3 ubiquitin-protein ligase LOG2 [Ipomoea nil]XP_019176595.1 PREDICTED: probable E3 ubiquitin-protein ligase LOG2 [Ipomoea nil]
METAGGGGVSRRRMLTADRKFDSPNLRDFLRVKEVSNSNGDSNNMAGLTLGDVLCREPRSTTAELPHRTLLDIIRDEPFVSKENRKTWKHFTEKLRLKLPGSACTSTGPADDTPLQQIENRTTDASRSARFSAANSASEAEPPSPRLIQPELTTSSEPPRRESDSATLIVLLQRSSSRAVDRGSSRFQEAEANGESREASGGELEPEARVDQPARLSLMALLAETDREMGIDGAAYVLGEEETEDETAAGDGGKFILDNCCVCMVRHKGAAFIPCGHTFCRLCSRELWVQRGSCPLCNNSISEILDIF